MQRAPTAPPLPPPPESNIGPYRQPQAPNLPPPSCIPHFRHGGSRLSGPFLPPTSSAPPPTMTTPDAHPRHTPRPPLTVRPPSNLTPVFDTRESDGGRCFPLQAPCEALWRRQSLPCPLAYP
ncbi:hypothetical protein ARMSODRAFT_1017636 [Armillaria solidipes]|uniref:Uncharacterized protein n=1 Tax=Armillaria solidipes TaxID=1076256 RepID=A0A2H3BJ50_9AGAR|nr:hypothetical protein ARMSODRAFT_1017636 [Armillaria solidipes]